MTVTATALPTFPQVRQTAGMSEAEFARLRDERPMAYFIMPGEPEPGQHIRPCIALMNVSGFWRTDYDYGTDRAIAEQAVATLNERLGVSSEQAQQIVDSSFR